MNDDDRALRAALAPAALADDGFSQRVVSRIARRRVGRRGLFFAATLIGASIAMPSLAELVTQLSAMWPASERAIAAPLTDLTAITLVAVMVVSVGLVSALED